MVPLFFFSFFAGPALERLRVFLRRVKPEAAWTDIHKLLKPLENYCPNNQQAFSKLSRWKVDQKKHKTNYDSINFHHHTAMNSTFST